MSARADGPPPTIFGHESAEAISALQKSIRRGDEESALYWATTLDRSGLGAWVWTRLLIIASEDCGLATPPGFVADIRALRENWVEARKRKSSQAPDRLFLVHAVLLLARARKSRIVDHALIAFYGSDEVREIPDVALDKHTSEGKRKGRGWDHFWGEGTLLKAGEPPALSSTTGEEGELSYAPVLEDAYRDRAIAVTKAPKTHTPPSGRLGQLELEPSDIPEPTTTRKGPTP